MTAQLSPALPRKAQSSPWCSSLQSQGAAPSPPCSPSLRTPTAAPSNTTTGCGQEGTHGLLSTAQHGPRHKSQATPPTTESPHMAQPQTCQPVHTARSGLLLSALARPLPTACAPSLPLSLLLAVQLNVPAGSFPDSHCHHKDGPGAAAQPGHRCSLHALLSCAAPGHSRRGRACRPLGHGAESRQRAALLGRAGESRARLQGPRHL